MKKIITIVGARPQFVKASVLTRAIDSDPDLKEFIVHTGQHYDHKMSEIFFDQLNIRKPDLNLNVGSSSHGNQTGLMISELEKVILMEQPDWIVLYGDTNSTLAGAVAASKISGVKIAHIEAGLRSFNKEMPEETNRILTDHVSDLCLAPTQNALINLENEGLEKVSYFSGDIMLDSTLYNLALAKNSITTSNYISSKPYYLATVHRQENTDSLDRLQNIFSAFSKLGKRIVLPIHPRTRQKIKNFELGSNIKILEPLGPLEFLILLSECELVLTDSGGLQKEAFFLRKPCITLRNETEWVETLDNGWNQVVGADEESIIRATRIINCGKQSSYFGDGMAAQKILDLIKTN